MGIFKSKVFRHLLKDYIVLKYKSSIENPQGDITRTSIKNYAEEIIKNDNVIATAMMKSYGKNNLDFYKINLNADDFKSWERFLKKEEEFLESTGEKTLKRMYILFQVPGYKTMLDEVCSYNTPVNKTPITECKYYIGFFFSDEYKLKKCLLEISVDSSAKFYYIDTNKDNVDIVRDKLGEYYEGQIEGGRAITLSKRNQYSQIILFEDHCELSDDLNESDKYYTFSALWQKERLKTYQCSNIMLLKRVRSRDVNAIDLHISLEEITKISSWRYDKESFRELTQEYNPEQYSGLSYWPGKYEIYQFLTNKYFSRFILEISNNLEVSLKVPRRTNQIRLGYIKIHPDNEDTIMMNFSHDKDFFYMALQMPPDYQDNKTILTGSIWETNNGKPFCGSIYVKKIDNPERITQPERIQTKDIIENIHTNKEYPGFIDYFLGQSQQHHQCIVSRDAYNELQYLIEKLKTHEDE